MDTKIYRPLSGDEIIELQTRGCMAQEWSWIEVAPGFDPRKYRNVTFSGHNTLDEPGDMTFTLENCVTVRSSIQNVHLHNCHVSTDVYINRVANFIANYRIGRGAFIDNVDTIAAQPDSTFGVGTRVAVLNETGGREVPIYPGMSAQSAYLMAMFRHDRPLTDALFALAVREEHAAAAMEPEIGSHAVIWNCGTLRNVLIGNYAELSGVSRLSNGFIDGSSADPVKVGTNVIAENFIFCSGAHIDDGAVVHNCFVGQACRITHLFSAHDSLFFANCVLENGEAAAIFAGPYTVSMHKSSLLIAGLFSFLNAGSGSNQSNHMYKLGPVHQGVLARGSKTASDSYILWPARIGAFSLVMGRHVNHPDTSELPFSYLIERYGRSFLVPGVNLKSVGTVRDALKWPKRDNRKDPHLTDRINFSLLSPFTAQKMLSGIDVLNCIEQTGGQTADTYTYRGMTIEPRALHNGRKYYSLALDKYMAGALLQRLAGVDISNPDTVAAALRPSTEAGFGPWLDLAGMFVPQVETEWLCAEIKNGSLDNFQAIEMRFSALNERYGEMEWTWVATNFERYFGKPIDKLTAEDIATLTQRRDNSVAELNRLLYEDAKKDYSAISQISFGVDGTPEMAKADFTAVRGDFTSDPFVLGMNYK